MPDRFFFYDRQGIMKWGAAYYQSGFNPGHLPRSGGILALTKREYHDWMLYQYGVAWAQGELEEERRIKGDGANLGNL